MADADNVINYINDILNTSTKTKFNITTLYNNYKTNNNIDKIHFKNVLDRNYKLDANKQNIIIKTNSDISSDEELSELDKIVANIKRKNGYLS